MNSPNWGNDDNDIGCSVVAVIIIVVAIGMVYFLLN